MECRDVQLELVHHARGEVSPSMKRALDMHLASCAACREEYARLDKTLRALRGGLAPIEPSADFRRALAERLEEATRDERDAANASATVSSRRLRELKDHRPVPIRLWEQARRSPYFAASVVLHAAALVLLGTIIGLQVNDAPRVRIDTPAEEPATQPVNMAVYGNRLRATRVHKRIARESDGSVRVDVGEFYPRGTLLLVEDPGLCVRAYFADAPGAPERDALKETLSGATVLAVADGDVRLPASMGKRLFAAQENMVVLHLDDRLEFWAPPRWDEYSGSIFIGRLGAPAFSDPFPADRRTALAARERCSFLAGA